MQQKQGRGPERSNGVVVAVAAFHWVVGAVPSLDDPIVSLVFEGWHSKRCPWQDQWPQPILQAAVGGLSLGSCFHGVDDGGDDAVDGNLVAACCDTVSRCGAVSL